MLGGIIANEVYEVGGPMASFLISFNKVILETDNIHWDSFVSLCNPLHPEPTEDIKVTSKKLGKWKIVLYSFLLINVYYSVLWKPINTCKQIIQMMG